MARYVLLTFDDNKEADRFVEFVRMINLFHLDSETGEYKSTLTGGVLVRGVWAKPVNFCECPPQGDDKFVKGIKLGLYVHTKCKRPRRGQFQHPTNLIDNDPNVDSRKRTMYLGVQEPLPPISLSAIEPTPKEELKRVEEGGSQP